MIDHGRNVVVEYDSQGRQRATWIDLPGRPSSLFGAADGSAWLAFPDLGLVGQVDREGHWRRFEWLMGRPVDAVPLVNLSPMAQAGGEPMIAVALSEGRQVIVLGPAGQSQAMAEFDSSPRSLSISRDGSLFATFATPGQVLRLDRAADTKSLAATLARGGWQGLRRAARFADGRWVVAEAVGVSVYDAAGKVLWKRDGELCGGMAVIE